MLEHYLPITAIRRADAVEDATLPDILIGDIYHLATMLEMIDDAQTPKLVEEGVITVVLIKPHTEESNLGVEDDASGENKMFKLMPRDARPVFAFSAYLTEEEVGAFYPDEKNADYVAYMTSGPVTCVVLVGPDVVPKWSEKAEMIRGTFAKDPIHDLVHASATTADVQRELGWVKTKIETLLKRPHAVK